MLTAADEVGQTANTLRAEVNDFLSAMKRSDGEDRRAYERIKGDGATASLRLPGSDETQAVVQDISRGGVALVCGVTASPGTDANVSLPGGARVSGRIVRSGGGLISIAFRQDGASLALVDRALQVIMQRARPAAA